MCVKLRRSRIDWDDDGVFTDYGWTATIYIGGKYRARWGSTRNTSKMFPRITRGADENCNRAITVTAWPLGHLDVWWEPQWRTDADGPCDDCGPYEVGVTAVGTDQSEGFRG